MVFSLGLCLYFFYHSNPFFQSKFSKNSEVALLSGGLQTPPQKMASKTSIFVKDFLSESPEESHLDPEFVKEMIRESRKVGQIDANPKETERRLFQWAQQLTEAQKKYLTQQAVRPHVEADFRFLSVYLLSQSGSSGRQLMEVAQTPISVSTEFIHLFQQEVLLRTMSLEGLFESMSREEAERKIREFIAQSDNTLLIHRARQLLSVYSPQA